MSLGYAVEKKGEIKLVRLVISDVFKMMIGSGLVRNAT